MNTKSVTVSAPGKLVLFGEHSVVHGYPAIVFAVDKRVSITVEPHKGDGVLYQVVDDRFVKAAAEKIREYCGKYGGVQIQSESTILYSGLGSSGAATVATIAALGWYYDLDLTNHQIFKLAHGAVKMVQENASSVDVAASVYGGVFWYKEGVSKKIESQPLPLIVCHSDEKAHGEKLVEDVFRRYEENAVEVDHIFEKIQRITENAQELVVGGDVAEIGELMNQQHVLLQNLGVSTKKLDDLVNVACSAGSYGAKLSGAGGGDCIIAVASEEKRIQVEKALRESGGIIVDAGISNEGFKVIQHE